MSRLTALMPVVLILAILSGCAAAPANKQAMIVTPSSTVNADQKGKFVVNAVTGGKVTNPFWTSQVSNESFGDALKESLLISGLSASENPSSKYKIDADLISLKQPMLGLTFDVVSTVNYKVYGDGFEKVFPIVATGTATTSDSLLAITRLKIANEKSIQENIKAFISELITSEIK